MKRAAIERLLPAIFQRTVRDGAPLTALLEAMEDLHAPSELALQDLDAALDPRRTPDRFVPFLARWVDLDHLFEERARSGAAAPLSSGMGRLRELTAGAARLSKWRGTRRGLLLFLETATGERGFAVDEIVTDESGRLKPFHIRIRAPEGAAIHKDLILRIIQAEKPAYVTYELVVGQAQPPDRQTT
ncbi:MAG TPA: phage tail protein [Candidatus Solibacter sp.]|nr:phage tail protein [Candidatus Solibacter sp.]